MGRTLLKSAVHLLFSPAPVSRPLAFEMPPFPAAPGGKRKRARIFVELGIWLARICFQNRLSRWAG